MKESWLPILGFEGIYEVSNTGLVRRSAPGCGTYVGKILKPDVTIHGYLQVTLFKGGMSKRFKVHRLVLTAFVGLPPTPKHQGNHLDGKKDNNNIINLEWATTLENNHHSFRCLGREASKGKDHYLYGQFGSKHHLSKTMIFISPSGQEFEVKGIYEFCRKNGLDGRIMSTVAKGGRNHHKGWKCRYV
jgi:hypothetical protein